MPETSEDEDFETHLIAQKQASLKQLKIDAISGDLSKNPQQIVPHILGSTLTTAIGFLELQKISPSTALSLLNMTAVTLRQIAEENPRFTNPGQAIQDYLDTEKERQKFPPELENWEP